jgi:Na+:H+ antiporter
MVFLLIGFEVNLHGLLQAWKAVLVAYGIVTLGRGVVIFVVSGLIRATRERIPVRWSAILTWGGLRGALPMVLVLSLPEDFPYRELLVSMTFGVVILSILIHGLTMSGLMGWLGIVAPQPERKEYELARGRMQAARAALRELEEMSQVHFADPSLLSSLRQKYDRLVEQAGAQLRETPLKLEDLQNEQLLWIWRRVLLAEKDEILRAFKQGVLTHQTYNHLLADVDARLLQVESGEKPELPIQKDDKAQKS